VRGYFWFAHIDGLIGSDPAVYARSEASPDEQHPEPEVVTVSEAAGDPAVEFDQVVDGLGGAVGGAGGGEVRQERLTPLAQRPTEAGDLGDRAGREGREDVLGDASAFGEVFLVERRPQLLGGLPRDVDLVVSFVRGDRSGEASPLRSVRRSNAAVFSTV